MFVSCSGSCVFVNVRKLTFSFSFEPLIVIPNSDRRLVVINPNQDFKLPSRLFSRFTFSMYPNIATNDKFMFLCLAQLFSISQTYAIMDPRPFGYAY